jgi:hypothetical protein
LKIDPQHSQALYNLSRILHSPILTRPKSYKAGLRALQAQQHIADRAQTLGNSVVASAAAHDFPQAISRLKEGIPVCGDGSALALHHKDLGLIY